MSCKMVGTSEGWNMTTSPLDSQYALLGYKLIWAYLEWGNAWTEYAGITVMTVLDDGRIITNNRDNVIIGKDITFRLIWAKL